MPWNSATRKMTAPLNINDGGDIEQATGVSSGNLGYCIVNSTIINKWAKYKPVRSSLPGRLTEDDLKSVNYGLAIDVCGPSGNISTFLANFASQWAYAQPRDNGIDWYRMSDFVNATTPSATGYAANASSFINASDKLLPTTYLVGQGDTGVKFRIGLNPTSQLPDGSLAISDLRLGDSIAGVSFDSLYFGLIFARENTYKIVTSKYAMGQANVDYVYTHGAELVIPESNGALTGLDTGVDYTVYPILSYAQHTSPTLFSQTDRIVAMPYSPFTFQAYRPSAMQDLRVSSLTAYMDRARPVVTFDVLYSRNVSAPQTISDGYYEVRSATASGDRGGSVWASGQINGGTMVAGTIYTINTGRLNQSNQGWVYVKVYRGTAQEVYGEAWAEISLEPLVI